MVTMGLIYDLGEDIPATKTLESLYSPFFNDFDRSREKLPHKIGIRLILI
jgi:hypothetical protein